MECAYKCAVIWFNESQGRSSTRILDKRIVVPILIPTKGEHFVDSIGVERNCSSEYFVKSFLSQAYQLMYLNSCKSWWKKEIANYASGSLFQLSLGVQNVGKICFTFLPMQIQYTLPKMPLSTLLYLVLLKKTCDTSWWSCRSSWTSFDTFGRYYVKFVCDVWVILQRCTDTDGEYMDYN